MRHPAAVILIGSLAMLAAARPSAAESVPEGAPPVIRISVERIQLDAVITDKKGHHVTDLRPDEIEIYQDGERQAISEFSYVRSGAPAGAPTEGQATAGSSSAGARTGAPTSVPTAALPTPRAVLIVLDDLSFGPHAYDRTHRALLRVIEGLDPKDRVDIVTTAKGFSKVVLTTDRKANRDAIAAMRRTPWTRAQLIGLWSQPGLTSPHRFDGSAFDSVDDMLALQSITVVKGAVKALREVPGRKALLLVSEGLASLRDLTLPQTRDIYWPLDQLYGDANDLFGALKRLAEFAARSGVVVYAVDPRGLVAGGLGAEASSQMAAIQDIHNPRAYGNAVTASHVGLYASQATLQYLTDETGGLTMLDSNDMAGSLTSIVSDLSGYYLIGYTPRTGTFDSSRFHRFEVKVKRSGLKVRTREGFYPVTDEQVTTALR